MAEAGPFAPVKLICGAISGFEPAFEAAEALLVGEFGPLDSSSEFFPFNLTDYYAAQMGGELKRRFYSFVQLIHPEDLSAIKLRTNGMEEEVRQRFSSEARILNLDPGCLTGFSLVMGTTKNFAHRIPLNSGIYAHLELIFGRDSIEALDWTYPDFRSSRYHAWLWDVRRSYLDQLKGLES
jgi:hypothetical protein